MWSRYLLVDHSFNEYESNEYVGDGRENERNSSMTHARLRRKVQRLLLVTPPCSLETEPLVPVPHPGDRFHSRFLHAPFSAPASQPTNPSFSSHFTRGSPLRINKEEQTRADRSKSILSVVFSSIEKVRPFLSFFLSTRNRSIFDNSYCITLI